MSFESRPHQKSISNLLNYFHFERLLCREIQLKIPWIWNSSSLDIGSCTTRKFSNRQGVNCTLECWGIFWKWTIYLRSPRASHDFTLSRVGINYDTKEWILSLEDVYNWIFSLLSPLTKPFSNPTVVESLQVVASLRECEKFLSMWMCLYMQHNESAFTRRYIKQPNEDGLMRWDSSLSILSPIIRLWSNLLRLLCEATS